jgi:hypothetical protein
MTIYRIVAWPQLSPGGTPDPSAAAQPARRSGVARIQRGLIERVGDAIVVDVFVTRITQAVAVRIESSWVRDEGAAVLLVRDATVIDVATGITEAVSVRVRMCAVCPVECCVPDEGNVESEEVLYARAVRMHPDQAFPAFTALPASLSRFRPAG